ncbi:hypothetical protein HK405_011106 [Cladochytrium tenue]|nr:hypothetical protein HK405_011106 [Cladochytrium tenue]
MPPPWPPPPSGSPTTSSASVAVGRNDDTRSNDNDARVSPAPILDLLDGFRKSAVLFTAVRLGVLDVLASAPEPVDGSGDRGAAGLDLAEVLSGLRARHGGSGGGPAEFSADAVARLLRAAAALGLVEVFGAGRVARGHGGGDEGKAIGGGAGGSDGIIELDNENLGENEDDDAGVRFALTPVAREFLVSTAPQSLAGYVAHSEATIQPLFLALPHAVRTGGTAWEAAFKVSAPVPADAAAAAATGKTTADAPAGTAFGSLYATPEARARFLRAMHSHATLFAPAVAAAFDLSFVRAAPAGGPPAVVDVGGGTAALALELVRRWPHLRRGGGSSVAVLDLPGVVAEVRAAGFPLRVADDGNAEVTLIEGDFFAELPRPAAQLYVLSRILHDWDDAACGRILARVAAALRSRVAGGAEPDGDGAVLIAETLLNEYDGEEAGGGRWRAGPERAVMQDLNMLVQTGGRERTARQYGRLLRGAGFRGRVLVRRTGAYLDAILAFLD